MRADADTRFRFFEWIDRERIEWARMPGPGDAVSGFVPDPDAHRVLDWLAAHARAGRKYPKGARYSDGSDVYTVLEDGPDRCGQVLCAMPDGKRCRFTPKGWRRVP